MFSINVFLEAKLENKIRKQNLCPKSENVFNLRQEHFLFPSNIICFRNMFPARLNWETLGSAMFLQLVSQCSQTLKLICTSLENVKPFPCHTVSFKFEQTKPSAGYLFIVTHKLLRKSITLILIQGIELSTFPVYLLQFLRRPTKLNGIRNREKVYCHRRIKTSTSTSFSHRFQSIWPR